MTWKGWTPLACLLAITGCTAYEYEEEVFLGVDGSGSLRVSGSAPILETLHTEPTTEALAARFEGHGLELDSVRETRRDGRRFLHVQGRFSAWDELCSHPAFADRSCGLDVTEDELSLRWTLPSPRRELPKDVPGDALVALRFHFPSSVRYHNSPTGIERGNIIEWERSAAEHFRAPDLSVEARFQRRSILASTLGVLGTALGIVAGSVGIALWVMVRKGRRQLALDDERHTSTVRRR